MYALKKDPIFHIGFGNMALVDRIVHIGNANSAPMNRIIQKAREQNVIIDATNGQKTRSIILTDSEHVILSAVHHETLQTSKALQNNS